MSVSKVSEANPEESDGQPVVSADDDTLLWRDECFIDLGFDSDWSAFLAGTQISIRRIEKLITRGCDPLRAVQIEAGLNALGLEDEWFDWTAYHRLLHAPPESAIPETPPLADEVNEMERALLG